MFTKITETIEAFRPHSPATFEDKRRAQHARQKQLTERAEVRPAVSRITAIIILAVVVIPVSIGVSALVNKIFHVNQQTVGLITSAILGYVLATIHQTLVARIVDLLPLRDLPSHFGSKLEETVQALIRRKRKAAKV